MTYDYRIVEKDPAKAFVKRVALYFALLLLIVSLALIVLLILFERYLSLLIAGGLLLLSVFVWWIVGHSRAVYEYHFTDDVLEIVDKSGKKVRFSRSGLIVEKNAEISDFFDKSIMKLTFKNGDIVIKNAVNDSTNIPQNVIVRSDSSRFLLGVDEYTLALIGGEK